MTQLLPRFSVLCGFFFIFLTGLSAGSFISLPDPGVQQGEAFSLTAWSSGSAFEGEYRLVLYPPHGDLRYFRVSKFRCAGGMVFHSILAMEMDAVRGTWRVELTSLAKPDVVLARAEIRVQSRNYPLDVLHLDSAMSALRTRPDPRKKEESRILTDILASYSALLPGAGYGRATGVPVADPRQTSYFGEMRQWFYSDGTRDSSRHSGLDFGGDGLEIHAMTKGKVVFAASRMLTGNTIVLEHAPGLMSLHYHLSRMDVTAGQVVEPGQRIGLSGKTGLATGPHLHWELRAQLVPADPLSLDQSVILDKSRILGIISLSLHP